MKWFINLFRGFLHLVYAFARIRCRIPRLTPNVTMMTPAVIRDSFDFTCGLWKYHDGEHEHETKDGIEHWS
jgi:hypothetical protein